MGWAHIDFPSVLLLFVSRRETCLFASAIFQEHYLHTVFHRSRFRRSSNKRKQKSFDTDTGRPTHRGSSLFISCCCFHLCVCVCVCVVCLLDLIVQHLCLHFHLLFQTCGLLLLRGVWSTCLPTSWSFSCVSLHPMAFLFSCTWLEGTLVKNISLALSLRQWNETKKEGGKRREK